MGEEYTTDKKPTVNVKITGTTPLHEVEVYNWENRVYRHPFASPEGSDKLFKIEWSGASVRSRPKIVNWNGGLKVENGSIKDYTEFAFDYHNHGIEKVSDRELKWTSTTGGDPDGVLLNLEYDADTEITFESGPATFNFRPYDINYEPKVINAGEFTEKVKISTIKETLPDTLEFSYTDENAVKGLNAYWVRVVQTDGMAWSSPIYINFS